MHRPPARCRIITPPKLGCAALLLSREEKGRAVWQGGCGWAALRGASADLIAGAARLPLPGRPCPLTRPCCGAEWGGMRVAGAGLACPNRQAGGWQFWGSGTAMAAHISLVSAELWWFATIEPLDRVQRPLR